MDLPGNVTALLGGSTAWAYDSQGINHAYGTPKTKGRVSNSDERTAYFSEGYIYNIELDTLGEATPYFGTNSIVATYSLVNSDYEPFMVVGDKKVTLDSNSVTLSISTSNYPFSTTTATYSSVFVIDSTGKFKVVNSTNSKNPAVASSDTVLAYVKFGVLHMP